jgi:hypothetical protein
VSFSVRVPKCVATVDENGLLLQVSSSLGYAFHSVSLPIDVVSDSCDLQLQFEMVYDGSLGGGIAASVGNVTLTNGSCLGMRLTLSLTKSALSLLYTILGNL